MGAVFMGALTYVGNAPNFMVSSIAAERGIKMPSFFGYLLRAGAVLIPFPAAHRAAGRAASALALKLSADSRYCCWLQIEVMVDERA